MLVCTAQKYCNITVYITTMGLCKYTNKSWTITVLLRNEIDLFTIPNLSSPTAMPMQSLKKVRQKILIRGRNEALTGGLQTDGHWNGPNGINVNVPPLFVWRGIINSTRNTALELSIAKPYCSSNPPCFHKV